MTRTARALWITGERTCALRDEPVDGAGPDAGMVVVEALASGISRGTEALVFRGGVPASEAERMRCPFQAGDFPWPVKYGYAMVGRAVSGPLSGREVFALHPHQDRFRLPATALVPLPEGVPAARAVLAANMETALTIVWDAGAAPGDRITIVGAGVVGALAAWLCARLPGAEVTLIDLNPARVGLAEALGCRFALPGAAPTGCDVAIHASASAAGLATALGCLGPEATLVEASWYGDATVPLALGGAFHSQRLRIVASQVGALPPGRRPRWTHRRRLELALRLLAAPVLDTLVSGETAFADLPTRYGAILDDPATLCHRIRYP